MFFRERPSIYCALLIESFIVTPEVKPFHSCCAGIYSVTKNKTKHVNELFGQPNKANEISLASTEMLTGQDWKYSLESSR